MKHKFLLLFLTVIISLGVFAQPTISSFSPVSGPVGTSVTITGTNFSTVAANNIVYFGGMKAVVTAASSTSLTVTVPFGAKTAPISITTAGLTAYSRLSFSPTFTATNNNFSKASFGRSSNTQGLEYAKAAVSGDFDGDGKLDLAIVNGNLLMVRRGISVGDSMKFALPVNFSLSEGFDVGNTCIAAADFDGDGLLDIAIGSYWTGGTSTGTISVYRNQGSPGYISFGYRMVFDVGIYPSGLVAVDIDRDGKPDIAVTNFSSNTVSILKNICLGTNIDFAAKIDLATGTNPNGIAIADFNGDGFLDIAVPNKGSNSVSLFKNTSVAANISFATKVDYTTPSADPSEIVCGDLDGDGKADLVTLNKSSRTYSIFKNNSSLASFSFTALTDLTNPNPISGLCLEDMNGDGKMDIITTSDYNLKLAVFKNTSVVNAISFSAGIQYISDIYNGPPNFITCADFNNDGRPDIAVHYSYGYPMSIFRSRFDEPFISSFNPTNAGAGQTINIIGENFTGTTQVKFSGTSAASFTVVNPNVINAVIPVLTISNNFLSVENPLGKDSVYVFNYSGPIISSFSPTDAAIGNTVTISGSNFTGVTAVSFGGVAASSFTFVSSNTITAIVAPGTVAGNVSVTTTSGTGTKAGFTVLLPPTITSFSPTSASGGNTVTITGTNLSSITSVSFGATPANYFFTTSPTTILAQVGNAGSSGSITISGPLGTAFLPGFTFLPSPNISSFAPTIGGLGTVVVIKGQNFSGVTQVSFGNVNASSFTILSDTIINAIVANGASGNVLVRTNNSSGVAAGFVHTGPTITSFSPTNGTVGTVVTITGTNFTGTTAVSFGATAAASFNIVSSSQITAVVPNGTASGNIVVSTPNGNATIAGFNLPVIKSFTPTNGTIGTVVAIKGMNFNGITAVTFGDSLVSSFTVLSDTTLSATVNKGGTGRVKVSSVLGTGTSSSVFFYTKPVPQLTLMTPSFGAQGTVVTIKGKNLGIVTSVQFGGVLASSFLVLSDTVLTAVVGAGATGFITLVSPNGNYSGSQFTYLTTPQIISFVPEAANVGTQVTINGVNFSAISANNKVFFGGIPASIVSSTTTSITAIVPAGVGSDFITLNTNNFSATSKKVFVTTFPNTLNTFSPNSFVQDYISPRSSIRLMADFDGDGKPDLITSDSTYSWLGPNDSFYVSRNVSVNGSVAFGERRFIVRGGSYFSAADLNNDGKLDLLVGYSSGVRIFINSSIPGAISFQAPSFLSTSTNSSSGFSTADFNNDGRLDILFVETSGGFTIYRNIMNNGIMTFTSMGYGGSNPVNVKIADLDGDGKLDIVTTRLTSGTATLSVYDGPHIYMNNSSSSSNITFSTTGITTGFANIGQIDVRDFDGDGKPDIVAVETVNPYRISFFKNSSTVGNPTFSVRTDYFVGKYVNNIAFGDYDGDSKPDMAVSLNDTVHIYRNTYTTPGTISFTKNCSYAFPIWNIAAIDLNLDGKTDIVGSGYANMPGLKTILLKNMADKPKVAPSGSNPVSGVIISSAIVDSSVQTFNGNPYVQRHYAIEPLVNAASSTGTVTLYFTQADFDNFNAYPLHGDNLPTGPFDIANKANLRVLQFHGTSTSNLPGTYSGSSEVIDPNDNNIIWNFNSMLWEVKFDVVGFSGFFVSSTGNTIVPIQLLSFNGSLIGKNAILNWTTTNELNSSHFVLEKSTDGTSFISLKTIQAAGNSNMLLNYLYSDKLITTGIFYYRLKMVDKDGKFTYSQVVKINFGNDRVVRISPNPAKDKVVIEYPIGKHNNIKIVDASGRIVKKNSTSNNSSQTTISIANLPVGIYKVIWSDGVSIESQTLIKQ